MNEELSPSDRSGSGSASPARSSFTKLFAVGVFGWFLGGVVLFGLSWRISGADSLPAALIWTISHCWIGFLAGLVLLAAYGIAKRLPLGAAALAYALPAAVLATIAGICLWVYPDNLLREELFTYLPVVLLFYVLGLVWLLLRKTSPAPVFACAVIPAVVGGLVILGFVAVPVFASDAFRYRDAFELQVSKTSIKDGTIQVEGSIEIRKPGNYEFSAPRYVWQEAVDSSSELQVEMGQITWAGAGEPKSSTVGVFPVQIVWKRGVPKQAGTAELPPYEDSVSIEVRSPEEGSRVIYSMCAPMLGK